MPKKPPVALIHSSRWSEVESDIVDTKNFLLVRDEDEALVQDCIAMLYWDDDKLCLQSFNDKQFKPLTINWAIGKSDYRRLHGGGGEMIGKAVGVKKDYLPTVVDSTAGLGQDSFVLATIGCSVTLMERSHVVRALLWDGLKRAREIESIAEIAQRMNLVAGDSITLLQNIESSALPDVVYCDPMFPERKKSALVKKEMRVFKDVVGEDPDASALLEQALKVAKKRVVVKRPRKAPIVEGPQPSHSLEGKACRFDVYMI